MVATAYLQDLIAAGFMAPEMSHLACDPSKLVRARKAAMESSREKDKNKYKTEKIVGMDLNVRRDKHMRAMVADSNGKLKMRMVTNEPSSLSHFTPETPVHPESEKPALKVAQGLFNILEQRNSTDSLTVPRRRLNKHEHGVEVSQPCTP